MSVPNGMWECPKCGDYVDNAEEICPRCGSKPKSVSVEYSAENAAPPPRNPTEMATIEPVAAVNSKKSSGAGFLYLFAWIVWIVGVFVAILKASTETDYFGERRFSFLVLIETLISYGLRGGIVMCISELFENVQTIANALQGFRITKKD